MQNKKLLKKLVAYIKKIIYFFPFLVKQSYWSFNKMWRFKLYDGPEEDGKYMFLYFKYHNTGTQWARKFKKVQAKKNSWNQINQFHEKTFFDQIPFFAISKMAKNQFLNWEKVSNYQKFNFTYKFFLIYLISRNFSLDFFKFSGPLWKSQKNSSARCILHNSFLLTE